MQRPPRIRFGGIARVVAPGLSRTGALCNLSLGGAALLVREPLPVGRRLTITLALDDGKPPISAHATVAWSHPAASADGEQFGVGVRFVRIDDEALRRIAALVAGHAPPREVLLGAVRVQLSGLSTRLRARARARAHGELLVESDLGWLRVGALLTIEVAPDDVRYGRLSRFALEVAPEGHARIVFTVDELPAAEADVTIIPGSDDDVPALH